MNQCLRYLSIPSLLIPSLLIRCLLIPSLLIPCLLMSMMGCGGGVIVSVNQPLKAPPEQAFLIADVTPKTAQLYVDERYIGRVGEFPTKTLLIPLNARRLMITLEGYETEYFLISPTRKGPISIKVKLQKRPTQGTQDQSRLSLPPPSISDPSHAQYHAQSKPRHSF